MQMVAGGKHGQSDRSRYSSWMEAGLQKKGRISGYGKKKLWAKKNSSEEIL